MNSDQTARKTISGNEIDSPEGVLKILSADSKKDDGIYICVAKNELRTITQSVYVRVKGNSFSCIVFAWTKISTKITTPTTIK